MNRSLPLCVHRYGGAVAVLDADYAFLDAMDSGVNTVSTLDYSEPSQGGVDYAEPQRKGSNELGYAEPRPSVASVASVASARDFGGVPQVESGQDGNYRALT